MDDIPRFTTVIAMAKERFQGFADPANWARRCRIEAARAIHPSTKAFLLEMGAEFERISGQAVNLDPDDNELQNAVAERLAELASRGLPLDK